jgi:hypothetical protein
LELSFKFCNFGDGAGVDGFYVALVHFYAWTKGFYQFPKIRGPWIKIVWGSMFMVANKCMVRIISKHLHW